MAEPDQEYKEVVLDCSSSELSFLKYMCQDKCVFCQSQEDQRKVLRCLHVACKPCIAEHLSSQNTVTCVRCHKDTLDAGPGRKLVDSLADWPELSSVDSPFPGTESTQTCQHSDDDEEPAVSKCGECDLYLCECHSTAHGLSKKTRYHTLTPLESVRSCSQNCQLHPTNQLESVCKTCDILLCAKCVAKAGHEDHAVVSAEQYTDVMVETLGDQLGQIYRDSTLDAEEEAIDSQIAGVMDETKTISESISDRFQSFRDELQKREDELKDELDEHCWEKLKTLEGRKEAVQERRAKQFTSQHLLKSSSGITFLQVSQAIKSSVEEETAKANTPQPNPVVLGGRFASDIDDELDDISRFSSLSFASAGAALEPFDWAGRSYCNLFDPQRKASGISLSYHNQKATACSKLECAEAVEVSGWHKWHHASALGNYNKGTVHFEIECLSNCGNSFFGVAFPNSPLSSPAFAKHGSRLIAWAGQEENRKCVMGGKLGQPWEDGDIIRLKMDCDAHKMTAVHVRSGDMDTIEIPSRYICLSVALSCDEAIRLRIPSTAI